VQVLRDFEPWAQHARQSGRDHSVRLRRCADGKARRPAIVSTIPTGFLGDALMDIEFVAVAHPCHPLHALGRELEAEDLSRNLHIVVRDSGTNPRDHGWWLNSSQRWTVTSPHTRMEMICNGIGFGWLAEHKIQKQLEQGLLKPLPLRVGQRRKLSLSLVVTNPELAGPATCRLAI
jgi:DNA-binding transcriptional LysR family regulator